MSEPSIDILKQRLADSKKIDPKLRDALADDLTWADAINGSTDPAMQGIKRLIIIGVRRELLAADRDQKMQDQVSGIVATCSKRHGRAGSTWQTDLAARSLGKFGLALKMLTPWRWPIVIVCCSPYGTPILRMIFDHYISK